MTNLAPQWIRTRPETLKALQFDGTESHGSIVLGWVQAITGCEGHFRAGVRDTPGALFIPVSGAVYCLNKGDWAIQRGGSIVLSKLENFGQFYEVLPCLPH